MASILAIDDGPETLALLEKVAQGMGHEITTADTPAQGRALFGQRRFDLIFLDLVLPETDGLELCKELRSGESNRQTPVVIYTSLADRELAQVAQQMGANFYLCKPARVEQIEQVIERMLGG